MKAQLVDAADNKICALERARKVEELQMRLVEMESEKNRLITQLQNYKSRCRSAVDSSMDKNRRDEQIITVSILLKKIHINDEYRNLTYFVYEQNLKDDIARLRVQLSETNHKLCQLQTFRTSVARLLHLRDIPHSSLLQRLQTLCMAHQV